MNTLPGFKDIEEVKYLEKWEQKVKKQSLSIFSAASKNRFLCV